MTSSGSDRDDDPQRLAGRIGSAGAVAWLDGGSLCLSARKDALGTALLDDLRTGKPALVAWMSGPGRDRAHPAQLRPTPEQALLLRAGAGSDYVASGLFQLDPPAPVTAVEAALAAVLSRHDALRTCFPRDETGAFTMQLAGHPPEVSTLHLRELVGASPEEALSALAQRESARAFDLEHGPLARVCVVRDGSQAVALLLSAHHVVMDRWSMDLLGEELTWGLMAAESGVPWTAEPAPSFAAAVARRQRELAEGLGREATTQARARMAQAAEVAVLPGRARQHLPDTPAGRVDRAFPAALKDALRRHGRPPVVLLAALALLLGRNASGQHLLRAGLPVARRPDERAQATVGCFSNTVPLLLDAAPDGGAARLLAGAARALDDAVALQDADMGASLEGRLAYGLSPFNVLISFQSGSRSGPRRFKPLPMPHAVAKSDLVVFLDDCGVTFEYAQDGADPAAVERLADDLPAVAARLLAEPALPPHALDPVPRVPQVSLPAADDPAFLLHAAALRHPDAVALTDWSRDPPAALTYRALAVRAARLAAALAERGVGIDDGVGVLVAGATERVVAALGISWSGAAWAPIDARWPESRSRDACHGLRLLLTDMVHAEGAPEVPVLAMATALAGPQPLRRPVTAPATALSHVLHTSGSTGVPKKVGIERRNVRAFIAWAVDAFDATSLARVVAMTPLSFDLSVFEMLVPLAAGGSVAVLASPLEAARRLPACEPTLLNTTPSVVRETLRAGGRLPPGATVNLAGEPFGDDLAQALQAAGAHRVINLYGPTETTTYSSFAEADTGRAGSAPIGRPIAGTRIRLGEPALPGQGERWRGEVLIGGAGVARGYLGRPADTAARFLPDDAAPGLLYATGDHAAWSADGELRFLGRADRQVKRRGVRIELDEVEAALLRDPSVISAAALFRPDEEGGRIIAVVVPRAGSAADTDSFRTALPRHMAPDEIHVVAALPETSSGKLDRQAIALARRGPRPADPPRTEQETVVAAVWAAVVGHEIADRQARFFEVGGDSLKLMRVAEQLERRFGVPVSPVDLLRNPTVADTARLVQGRLAVVSGEAT